MKADLRFSGYYVQGNDNIQPGSDEPGAKVMVDSYHSCMQNKWQER